MALKCVIITLQNVTIVLMHVILVIKCTIMVIQHVIMVIKHVIVVIKCVIMVINHVIMVIKIACGYQVCYYDSKTCNSGDKACYYGYKLLLCL